MNVDLKPDNSVALRRARIDALARLDTTLEHLVVSAEIDADGTLKPVDGLTEKLKAALEGDKLNYIHAVGVAAGQTTSAGEKLSEAAFYKNRLIDSESYDGSTCKQPIIAKGRFLELVEALDKTCERTKRFGNYLKLPRAFVEDQVHYGAAGYVPLPWLNDAIRNFIDDDERKSGYIVIAADAIWGKSSFALNWWRQNPKNEISPLPKLAGAAFIRIEEGGRYASPRHILEWLEGDARYNLNLPLHDRRTAPVDDTETAELVDSQRGGLDKRETREIEERFAAFLDDLKGETRKSVLLLDGVDEIWGPSGSQPSTLLPGALPKSLPEGVFIVLLSRPGYHLRWRYGSPDSCLWIDLSSEAEDKTWQALNRQHLKTHLSEFADKLEAQGYPDAPQLLREATLAGHLVDATQGHMFVLRALLEDDEDEDLVSRLRRWRVHPEQLPKGATRLVARVLDRIGNRLDRAKDENALGKLDPNRYALQTLACLALTASLRQAIGVADLKSLLFDDRDDDSSSAIFRTLAWLRQLLLDNNRGAKQGRIALSGRCGTLRWKKDLDEDVMDAALHFGAECFAGHLKDQFPRTTTFWHPRMRDVVRAAWRVAHRQGIWPSIDDIIAEMERTNKEAVTEAEYPLHLWVAAVASRYWPPEGALTERKGGALSYALAWGPWHATQAGDEAALSEAAQILGDPDYLQAAYNALGMETLYPIDAALGHICEIRPALSSTLYFVRRTLSYHDNRLSQGVMGVFAALYNDLGSQWANQNPEAARLLVKPDVLQMNELVRRQPGAPTALLRSFQVGDSVRSLAISPCGGWLAAALKNKILLYSVAESGFRVRLEACLGGHSGWAEVYHITFSPMLEGQRLWLASAWSDHQVGLVELKPGAPVPSAILPIGGHSGAVHHVTFSPLLGGQRVWLASASAGGQIGLVDLTQGVPVPKQVVPICESSESRWVNDIAFSPIVNGQHLWLACALSSAQVGLIELTPGFSIQNKMMIFIEGHSNDVLEVAFSPLLDGQRLWLASASRDALVGLVDMKPDAPVPREIWPIRGHSGAVRNITFSPLLDGQRLWLASSSEAYSAPYNGFDRSLIGLVELIPEAPVPRTILPIGGHWDTVDCVAFSPLLDSQRLWLASGSLDSMVGILEIESGKPIPNEVTRIHGYSDCVWAVAFSSAPGSQRFLLVSATKNGQLGLMDSRFLKQLLEYAPELHSTICGDSVKQVAFSPSLDDQRLLLAIGYDNGHVSLFESNPPTSVPMKREHFHEFEGASTKHVALSPMLDDSQLWFASAYGNNKVGLVAINPEKRGKLASIGGHDAYCCFNHVTFSPLMDGQRLWLASASSNGHVGLVELALGAPVPKEMFLINSPSLSNNHLAFSPLLDGQRLWLASAGDYGMIGLVELKPRGAIPEKMINVVSHSSVSIGDDGLVDILAPLQDEKMLNLDDLLLDIDFGTIEYSVAEQKPSKAGTELDVGDLRDIDIPDIQALIADFDGWTDICAALEDSVGEPEPRRKGAESMLSKPDPKEKTTKDWTSVKAIQVAFSPVVEGQRLWLASVSSDGEIGLLELKPEEQVPREMVIINRDSTSVHNVAFSSVQKDQRLWLACAFDDGKVGLVELKSGALIPNDILSFEGHSDSVQHVAFSSLVEDQLLLLVSASDDEVCLWRVADRRLLACASFSGAGERIHSLRWSNDNRQIYVAGSRSDMPVDLTLIVPDDILNSHNLRT